MTPRNLKDRLPQTLAEIYAGSLTKGEVFDKTTEIVELITTLLLKHPQMRVEHLVSLFGLDDDVEDGMPNDSKKILAFNFASEIVRVMFAAKEKQSAENQARIDEMISELGAEESNVTRIH